MRKLTLLRPPIWRFFYGEDAMGLDRLLTRANISVYDVSIFIL